MTLKATREAALSAGGESNDLVCMRCGARTAPETLSMLGARCERCYAAYVSSGAGVTPKQPDVRFAEDKKAWALALRGRETAGERLTHLQRQAWRDVLGVEAQG